MPKSVWRGFFPLFLASTFRARFLRKLCSEALRPKGTLGGAAAQKPAMRRQSLLLHLTRPLRYFQPTAL